MIGATSGIGSDGADLPALRRAGKADSPEALRVAAQQFEGLFMNMVMKSMRDATPQDSPFDSQQSRMYTSMLDQKISDNFSKRGMGLADALMRQLTNNAAGPSLPALEAGAGAGAATNLPSSPSLPSLPPLLPRQTGLSATPPDGATPLEISSARQFPARPDHVQAFQDKLAVHANEASRATGIPAKFMLGQAALETGWGKREIRGADGSTSHNLFGIKATGNWTGKTVEVATTEYENGVAQKKMEKFRAYDSYADSFRDYANLLKNNPRYQNVIANGKDATAFAQGLQAAGYATDPNYAAKLSRIIQQSLSG